MMVMIVIVAAHGGRIAQNPGYVEAETLLAFADGDRGRAHRHRGGAAISAGLPASGAGANGAYAVDAADIRESAPARSRAGCRRDQHRFLAVANPPAWSNPFKPVELSMLTNRARSDGDGAPRSRRRPR
jgi:hypothetical protein